MVDTTPNIESPTHYQCLRAKNDSNGNARRLYVLYSLTGGPRKVIEDAYNTPDACLGLMELSTIEVAPSVYREWVKLGNSLNG